MRGCVAYSLYFVDSDISVALFSHSVINIMSRKCQVYVILLRKKYSGKYLIFSKWEWTVKFSITFDNGGNFAKWSPTNLPSFHLSISVFYWNNEEKLFFEVERVLKPSLKLSKLEMKVQRYKVKGFSLWRVKTSGFWEGEILKCQKAL